MRTFKENVCKMSGNVNSITLNVIDTFLNDLYCEINLCINVLCRGELEKQFRNHGQISCICEHRLFCFYLSLYFKEVDNMVYFIIVCYTLYLIIYIYVNHIVAICA